MKKSILLASGFSLASLFSSCEKAVMHPQERVSINSHAENIPDFYVVSEDGSWGRRYYTRDGEFHRARMVASFDNSSNVLLTVVDAKNDSDASIHFNEATQIESMLRIVTAEGYSLHEQSVPIGTTDIDLSKVRVADDHHRVGSSVQLLTKSSVSSLQFTVVAKLP